MAASAFLGSILWELLWWELFSDYSLAKGTFDETKMATCCVKGCSSRSKLNKNISYCKDEEMEIIDGLNHRYFVLKACYI